MYLIAGLGNPDRRFENTRHNIGFMAADRLVGTAGAGFVAQHDSLVSMIRRCKHRVVVAKPQTYMNRSGAAVRKLMKRQQLELEDLLVVYDDVDLPFGRIRLRPGGGSGGHNGMNSIIAELASQEFARLRIGIGRAAREPDLSSFVLDVFDQEEMESLDDVLDFTLQAVDSILIHGIEKSMARFNERRPLDGPSGSKGFTDE